MAFSLKQQPCPHCGCSESLNRHSLLRGNSHESPNARIVRGQRVWCSNRGNRGGCGRSFSVLLASVLPRFSIPAPLLWLLLFHWLDSGSLSAAAQSLRPFALESFRRLARLLRSRLDALRSRLSRETPPPASSRSDPLLQTVEHLKSLFPDSSCPPAEFQLRFQLPFLG